MPRIVDLRSDTVTKPSPEMRRAIYEAKVGDDVFGDDPTVNKLQERVAELLGKEVALYVPSGSMANQIAVACHTSPGDEIYCEAGCHVYNFEGGGAAHFSNVMFNTIEGINGAYTANQVEAKLRPDNHHFAPSRLIWVENSANRAGGTIFPQDEILRLRNLADNHGLGFHLDGARIWNVAAATGKTEAELADPFDSVNVCLSKGLGAPVGSLVVGSVELIDRAHRFRKRLGGGMRQAGIIAAAGLYAVENNRTRLVKDHKCARRLAEAINKLDSFSVALETVATNIIIIDTTPSGLGGIEITARLRENGVWGTSFGGTKARFVTHLDVNDDDIDYAIEVFAKVDKLPK
ncbi:aminotransferase class I/II-fold pyridoxal phosphate-dependent enzyme [bacterium]|nr:aminotransferase class I/II-fold pyridoxal phosphate-dependent enzyme [bacterium]